LKSPLRRSWIAGWSLATAMVENRRRKFAGKRREHADPGLDGTTA
jgi:hypothetical protein